MNIFFTAPIKGGRAHQPEFVAIVAALTQYGTVHAPHISEAELSQHGEAGLPDAEIFDRELAALAKADLVVAEVTTPALGVGYLIAEAVRANKKVVALYQGDSTLKLSSMIKGDPHITVLTYKTAEDVVDVIKPIFQV